MGKRKRRENGQMENGLDGFIKNELEENFEISNKSTEILNFKISVICQN